MFSVIPPEPSFLGLWNGYGRSRDFGCGRYQLVQEEGPEDVVANHGSPHGRQSGYPEVRRLPCDQPSTAIPPFSLGAFSMCF